ncbi:type II toxin-antitoxin system VapC family toxin [Algoriphagus hitonicola]|uniref:Predicted nucleic acid-binding protein, contains PIN domain n=1 Tax=Algoriphagus hitonicola TaxID=435880 RepID=A0A1I2UVR9_9BACT|nr:PIN domain-containing protein [Algoriphagus hitonicola]SFG79917.1 Predicted nucleic acid-binding protein, contains PIN domain [Algoriphagus hitonicola]
MKRIFVNANILIDFLTQRKPFDVKAGIIFSLAEKGEISCGVSVLSIANTHYHLLKLVKPESAKELIRKFKLLLQVKPLNEKFIDLSLNNMDFRDFEDALQYYTALEYGYESILTRNLKDFKRSNLPVFTPSQLLEVLKK